LAAKATQSTRVLAVDDEETILRLYQTVITSRSRQGQDAASDGGETGGMGVELTLCRQAPEAVAAVERASQEGRPYALAFLDVTMPPGPDGIWAAEQIRGVDHRVQVVLVTAFLDIEPAKIIARVPPADRLLYLEKPFNPEEIRQFVLALGTKWRVEEQLRMSHAWMLKKVHDKTSELLAANRELEERIRMHEQVQQQLREKIEELERFNRLTVDRELRMIQLKQEVDEMARKAGLDAVYDLPADLVGQGDGASAQAGLSPPHPAVAGTVGGAQGGTGESN
jgi:CheY-like chemotaxis protein